MQFKNQTLMKLGNEVYRNLYKSINDTVEVWSNNNIQFYYGKKNINWEVDSLICINNSLNKVITVIHKRCLRPRLCPHKR